MDVNLNLLIKKVFLSRVFQINHETYVTKET